MKLSKHPRLPAPPWPKCLTWADPRFQAIAVHTVVLWGLVTPLLLLTGVKFDNFVHWYLAISLAHAAAYLQGYRAGYRQVMSSAADLLAKYASAVSLIHPGLGERLLDYFSGKVTK